MGDHQRCCYHGGKPFLISLGENSGDDCSLEDLKIAPKQNLGPISEAKQQSFAWLSTAHGCSDALASYCDTFSQRISPRVLASTGSSVANPADRNLFVLLPCKYCTSLLLDKMEFTRWMSWITKCITTNEWGDECDRVIITSAQQNEVEHMYYFIYIEDHILCN